ncbi:hypothetical protein HDU82_008369 [Entophlyctis luteolus]|nr:hypothetical protein HDU82_008369 [Entophlyctis luteolus]
MSVPALPSFEGILSAPSIALALAASAAFGVFFLAHMFWLEAWTDFLYFHKKILKRRTPLGDINKKGRFLFENYTVLFVVVFPALAILAPHLLRAFNKNELDLSFRPLDVILSTILSFLCFDIWFFFAHRTFHKVPFLYKHIHKRHHEDLPVRVYLTAKAEYLEHLLATTPGLCAWVMITLWLTAGNINLWTFVLPAMTLIMDFNVNHSGFLDHPLLYIVSPLQWFHKTVPFSRWVSVDHKVHHLHLTKNFALMFSFLDILAGLNKAPAYEKCGTTDVIEAKIDLKNGM